MIGQEDAFVLQNNNKRPMIIHVSVLFTAGLNWLGISFFSIGSGTG